MNQKIVSFAKYKNSKKQKNIKMFFLTIVIGAAIGVLSWNYFVENIANLDVQIPPSQNIIFNQQKPVPMTVAQIANEFENADGKPILLYIYTTWCKVCVKNFPAINETIREFQNTELRVITLAIDRNLDPEHLQRHLDLFGNIYFPPQYLAFKEGFIEFLQKRNIRYDNRIPFTILISKDGEVITKFSGIKKGNYLRNKIIKELFHN